jgi:hypothetical protein
MSKSRKKNQRGKGPKRKSRYSDSNISRIDQHERLGSTLSPPLARLPKLAKSSWADDHMPEMLWAVLLAGVLERRHYLQLLRKIAVLGRDWFKDKGAGETKLQQENGQAKGFETTAVLDHTKLAEITEEQFRQFISIPLRHPLGYAALRPLLLVESLPGLDRWKRSLNVEPTNADWHTLAEAIAGVLDHQSEKSTDVRWFKLILTAISGHIHFQKSMSDRIEELRLFPDKGDMRSVRPFIRSGEMMLRRNPPSPWIVVFWAALLEKTDCIDPSSESEYSIAKTTIDPKTLFATRHQVIQRFLENMSATRTDARLDSAFGLVLYALAIVQEIGQHTIHSRIMGRLALRTLVDASITLRYLAQKDSDELWKSYRVYGAGQAKLAFLKAQELEGDLPPFMDEDALFAIANEDLWQEFLDIDVGHWANSNLRQLSIDCGAKELYDRYYDWTSAFGHGHWGAVRDTNFVTCHNSLHRLHRIPRILPRSLNSVEIDAIDLTNGMLGVLERLFPDENNFGRLSIIDPVERQ